AAVWILEGVAQAWGEAETGLLLIPVGAAAEGSPARAINAAAVDAFALYSLPDDDPAVQAALARSEPTVIIDQPLVAGVPYVGHDDRSAARLALTHLLGLSHRSICVVTYRLTPTHHSGEVTRAEQLASGYHHTRTRLRGYGDALDEAGLGWATLRFFESDTNDPA